MRKLLFVICLSVVGLTTAHAQIQFLITNDMGRNGYYEQKAIAELMGQMAEENDFEAVLALGDVHHFMGVESVTDPLWLTNFELIYAHPELQIPWYPILGNHEYRGNTQAVINYSKVSRRWEMPGRYYTKVFNDDNTSLRIIFLDTTPLIDKYHQDAKDYPSVKKQKIKKQLKWFEKILSRAKEDWVVVVGHHPIYADTSKDTIERADMQKRVDAIMRRHHVNMYICGHIHNFQHFHFPNSKIDYVVNSAASLSRKNVKTLEGAQFVSGEPGFSILTCTKDMLKLDLINSKGKIIHSITQK